MADEVKLPTQEEIAQLPRWARVAFAARCARRVLPLFPLQWLDAPEAYLEYLSDAVELCEDTAGQAVSIMSLRTSVEQGKQLEASFENAQRQLWEVVEAAKATKKNVQTVGPVAAALSAATAGTIIEGPSSVSADKARSQLSEAPIRAAIGAVQCGAAESRIRCDLDALVALSQDGHWTDDTPVPPSVFGPLDEPADEPSALVLELRAPSGTDPKDIGDAVVKLWEVANEYHMARGGGVLTFDEFKQMMPALVPVGPHVEG